MFNLQESLLNLSKPKNPLEMMFLNPGIEFQFNSELENKSKGGLLIKISWNVMGEHDKH